jgi:hypothetical protein
MHKSLLLALALLPFSLLPLASAAEKSFPKKDPVFTYVEPKGWTTEVDKKDGSISVGSEDGNVAVNFTTVPAEATMEAFASMLPAMVNTLKDAKLVENVKEHTEDGITGYTATYSGKIKGVPVVSIYMLLKGGKDRAVLGNVLVGNPAKLPEADSKAMESFMNSMHGVGQGESFPLENPVFTFVTPPNWKKEVDKKDDSISLNSEDGRISVNFGVADTAATMEVFETMLPAMTKTLEDATVAQKPKEESEDGIDGFTATYTGKIQGKPVVVVFTLMKGGKNRSIVGNVIAENPKTLPKEDDEAMGNFMKSIKGIGQK